MNVPLAGSYNSAEASDFRSRELSFPPAMRTRPSGRRVAVSPPNRTTFIDPVGPNVPECGSYNSVVLSPEPPATRTRPSRRRVAVWPLRTTAIDPVRANWPWPSVAVAVAVATTEADSVGFSLSVA
jgi:hypothetical protein